MTVNTAQTFIRPEKFWKDIGLRANQSVVHLGSGAGFYLIPAAKIVGSKGRVVGIDVREDMLREVENRAAREGLGSEIETIRSDIEDSSNQPLESESMDWTLVANILYQADPNKIFAEAKRVTKKTGFIVVIEWDTAATPLGPPAEHRLTKEEVIRYALEQGLLAHQEFSPSPYHFGILFTTQQKNG